MTNQTCLALGMACEIDRLRAQVAQLRAELKQSRDAYQHMIDQTTPLEPVPGDPRWSKRIELDEVIAERDRLDAECGRLLEGKIQDAETIYILEAEQDQLRAVVESLLGDAERYSRLRDGQSWPAVFGSSDAPEPIRGAELDAEIDTAMTSKEDP